MNAPKVLIGLSTGEVIRRSVCMSTFLQLQRPEGSLITTVHGQSPAKARNIIFQQTLDHDCTHVFLCDDDMMLPPNIIPDLLKHDVDVVTGLYVMRDFPHIACMFDDAREDGWCKYKFLREGMEPVLTEIVNTGFGAVLIKAEVIKALEEYAPYWVTLGEITKDGWCDDVAFYNKVRSKGFKIYCDMSISVGHVTSVVLFPRFSEGKWFTELGSATGGVTMPAFVPAIPQLAEDEPKQEILATPELAKQEV